MAVLNEQPQPLGLMEPADTVAAVERHERLGTGPSDHRPAQQVIVALLAYFDEKGVDYLRPKLTGVKVRRQTMSLRCQAGDTTLDYRLTWTAVFSIVSSYPVAASETQAPTR